MTPDTAKRKVLRALAASYGGPVHTRWLMLVTQLSESHLISTISRLRDDELDVQTYRADDGPCYAAHPDAARALYLQLVLKDEQREAAMNEFRRAA